MAKPLGAIFWVLSVSCLGVGIANYASTSFPLLRLSHGGEDHIMYVQEAIDMIWFRPETVNKYSRRAAIVQSGCKTQAVSNSLRLHLILSLLG